MRRGKFLNALLDARDRVEIVERELLEREAAFEKMNMAVDDAGHGHAARQVDDLGGAAVMIQILI